MSEYDNKVQREIGARIRGLIDQSGRTRMQIAASAGIGRPKLKSFIDGKALPKAQEIIQLSRVLGTTPNYLLSGSNDFEVGEGVSLNSDVFIERTASAIKIMHIVSKLDVDDAKAVEKIVRSLGVLKFSKAEFQKIEEQANSIVNDMRETHKQASEMETKKAQ